MSARSKHALRFVNPKLGITSRGSSRRQSSPDSSWRKTFFSTHQKNVEEKIDFDKKRGTKIIEAEIRKTKRCDRLRKCVESDFEQRQSQCFFLYLSLSFMRTGDSKFELSC